MRPSVVLPQPDSPTTPRVSPLRRMNPTSSTARNGRAERMKPPLTGKSLVRPSTWSGASVMTRASRRGSTRWPAAGGRRAGSRRRPESPWSDPRPGAGCRSRRELRGEARLVGPPAADAPPVVAALQDRHGGAASVQGVGTARMEPAARGKPGRGRSRALDGVEPGPLLAHLRDRAQQEPRVGMAGRRRTGRPPAPPRRSARRTSPPADPIRWWRPRPECRPAA